MTSGLLTRSVLVFRHVVLLSVTGAIYWSTSNICVTEKLPSEIEQLRNRRHFYATNMPRDVIHPLACQRS